MLILIVAISLSLQLAKLAFYDALFVRRQIKALVEDKYVNHMKMTELEEQRARLCSEVECLKAAAKSSTLSEQQWKGDLVTRP